MNDPSRFRDQVRQFITSNFYVADVASLSDDASLLDRGIIDSTGVLELIEFIESMHRLRSHIPRLAIVGCTFRDKRHLQSLIKKSGLEIPLPLRFFSDPEAAKTWLVGESR